MFAGGQNVYHPFGVKRSWMENMKHIWNFLCDWNKALKVGRRPTTASCCNKYEQVFGRESLKIVSFNNLVEHNVDLFKHFCEVIVGLPEAPRVEKRVDRNVGVEMTETEITRALNYMHYVETLRSDPSMHVKFSMLNKQNKLEDLQALKEHMKADVKEVPFKETTLTFRPAFEAINAYRDRLVSPEYGGKVFELRNTRVQFVGQNYLLRKGAVDEVERLYRFINSANLDSLLLQRIAQRAATAQKTETENAQVA